MPPKAQKVVLKMKIYKGILSRKFGIFFENQPQLVENKNQHSLRMKTISRGEKI